VHAVYNQYLKKLKLFEDITEVPALLQCSHYPSLDGLRGIAVLIVVLAHFGINHILRPYHLNINSDTGVDIFFVLSGFLITTLLLKEKLKNGNISLKRFYIRRLLRILPAAYLFLIVLGGLNFFYGLRISFLDFITSILFLKNLPLKNEPYTAHFWTLAIEMQFYFIFPYLLASNIKRYAIVALAIVIIVPSVSVVGYYESGFLHNNAVWHLVTKVCMYTFWKGPVIILIGSLSSILLFKGIIPAAKGRSNSFLSFILLIVAIVISSRFFVFYCKYLSEYLSAILLAMVIPLSLKSDGLLTTILKKRALVFTGIISYSIYLWQQLFIGVHVWQSWMMTFQAYPVWLLIVLRAILTTVIALLSYYLIELKFLKIKSRYELPSGSQTMR
jgi:peptidoglycan/LPS O-acetylase OafA/YrhL